MRDLYQAAGPAGNDRAPGATKDTISSVGFREVFGQRTVHER